MASAAKPGRRTSPPTKCPSRRRLISVTGSTSRRPVSSSRPAHPSSDHSGAWPMVTSSRSPSREMVSERSKRGLNRPSSSQTDVQRGQSRLRNRPSAPWMVRTPREKMTSMPSSRAPSSSSAWAGIPSRDPWSSTSRHTIQVRPPSRRAVRATSKATSPLPTTMTRCLARASGGQRP